jgi:hypothetical protein
VGTCGGRWAREVRVGFYKYLYFCIIIYIYIDVCIYIYFFFSGHYSLILDGNIISVFEEGVSIDSGKVRKKGEERERTQVIIQNI